ncbi:unnamed protein product [Callosobruchus maculatus]|uniref:Uncharacterized protein n=1 Tax=Callosobruchus maculatus TaxID=64391 RepID=A0A653CLB4_CALMS|nr:unnamed protein product [Callosobruchus maculatus]
MTFDYLGIDITSDRKNKYLCLRKARLTHIKQRCDQF